MNEIQKISQIAVGQRGIFFKLRQPWPMSVVNHCMNNNFDVSPLQ